MEKVIALWKLVLCGSTEQVFYLAVRVTHAQSLVCNLNVQCTLQPVEYSEETDSNAKVDGVKVGNDVNPSSLLSIRDDVISGKNTLFSRILHLISIFFGGFRLKFWCRLHLILINMIRSLLLDSKN